jgi:hypothetical protein
MLFTGGFIILGFYRDKFLEIARDKAYGGGPAESIVRIANQANVMVELDEGVLTTLVTQFDRFVSQPIMWAVGQCLPDFSAFSTAAFAADGYNVPWTRVAQDVTTCLGVEQGQRVQEGGRLERVPRDARAALPSAAVFREGVAVPGVEPHV